MTDNPTKTGSAADRIRRLALDLGFNAVGFARLTASRSMDRLREWIRAGRHGDMAYLERYQDLRSDPRQLAPGAVSLVAVAASYPVNPRPGAGVSSYARGLDYHDVIRRKLKRLARVLRDDDGSRVTRICVDSAPLLEREWAQAAGLGWIGRQGQLVNPDLGACLLLGFVLVDLELTPSRPMESRCGHCRRCLDACPTDALLGDGTMDARRCISYLTIESASPVPTELESSVAGALFGCDRCTAACPFNPEVAPTIMPELLESTPAPSPEEILRMNTESFVERFAGTPLKRPGLERLQRNAALARQYTGAAKP